MSSVFQELDGLAPQGYYEEQLDRIRNRGSSISNNFQGGVPSMQGGNAGDIGDWMDFYNRQKSVIWDGRGNQIGFNHGYGREERWDPQQPGDDKWISDEELERIRYEPTPEAPIGVRPPDVDPNRDTSRDIDMGPIPMPGIDDQRPSPTDEGWQGQRPRPTDEGWNSKGPGTSPGRGQIENILREGYQNILGRDADAEGLKYWTDQVMANPDERGYGRAIQDAMDNINRSEESINRTNYSEGDRYSKDELDRRRQIINREDYINRDDSRSFDSRIIGIGLEKHLLLIKIYQDIEEMVGIWEESLLNIGQMRKKEGIQVMVQDMVVGLEQILILCSPWISKIKIKMV